ncbi:MAG: hypothetical protein MI920_30305, partial [Kiloniellales bacterium]|nr:hypothetical protein [Kiloniellales bacterium]
MRKAFAGIEIAPHAEERSTERVSKHAGCLSSAPSLLSFLSQNDDPFSPGLLLLLPAPLGNSLFGFNS